MLGALLRNRQCACSHPWPWGSSSKGPEACNMAVICYSDGNRRIIWEMQSEPIYLEVSSWKTHREKTWWIKEQANSYETGGEVIWLLGNRAQMTLTSSRLAFPVAWIAQYEILEVTTICVALYRQGPGAYFRAMFQRVGSRHGRPLRLEGVFPACQGGDIVAT